MIDRSPKKLIGYVRVSTEEQVNAGSSLDTQKNIIRDWVRLHGHHLVDIAEDPGRSGKIHYKKRPGLSGAIERIAQGGADGLVFTKLDRLSRNLGHLKEIADKAKAKGWHLCSCYDHIDTTSAVGSFMLHMLGALAELEVEQTRERVVRGIAGVTRQNRIHSPRTPWGFRLGSADGPWRAAPRQRDERKNPIGLPDSRPLVPHPEEQRLRTWLLQQTAQGATPYRLAKYLREAGIPHPRGGAWHPNTIRSIVATAKRRDKILSDSTGHHLV